MSSPRNVEFPPWYGQCLALGKNTIILVRDLCRPYYYWYKIKQVRNNNMFCIYFYAIVITKRGKKEHVIIP